MTEILKIGATKEQAKAAYISLMIARRAVVRNMVDADGVSGVRARGVDRIVRQANKMDRIAYDMENEIGAKFGWGVFDEIRAHGETVTDMIFEMVKERS